MNRRGIRRGRIGGGGAPPSPPSIFGASAVRLWLARDLGITLGTPPAVATWADQSSSANNATQVTAGSRPSLTSDGVDFDGTDDFMSVADHASLDLTTAMTIGIRFRLDNVADNEVLLSKSLTTGGSWVLQNVGTEGRIWVRFSGLTLYGRLSALSSATWYSLVVVYDGTQATPNNRMKAWVNGVSDSGIAYNGTIPATLVNSAQDVVLGRWADDVQKLNGQLRSVVIAAASATDAQIAQLTSYLTGT